jgi:hypothetical protein
MSALQDALVSRITQSIGNESDQQLVTQYLDEQRERINVTRLNTIDRLSTKLAELKAQTDPPADGNVVAAYTTMLEGYAVKVAG